MKHSFENVTNSTYKLQVFKKNQILNLSRGSGKIRQAITQFKDVHDGYPSYQNKITCAFIAAFLYETELNDREMAEKLYLQIIESYPESYEASVARVSLQHLYETSDELISRLKQNE